MTVVTTEIERLIFGGRAVSRHNGKVLMVRGPVMPGEVVDVVIDGSKRDYDTAVLESIRMPSHYRIDPPCPYFGRCGGCSYQHIPYSMQLEYKQQMLEDCLRRIGGIETVVSEIIHGNEWHYRIRGQYKVSPDGIGFHEKGSRRVIPVGECLLMSRKLNDFVSEGWQVLRGFKMREIHVTGDEYLTALIIARKKDLTGDDTDRLWQELAGKGLSGLMVKTGEGNPAVYGNPSIRLKLLDIDYIVSPRAFIQSNWELNQSFLKLILKDLEPVEEKRVLDLYAGAGNFSLPLARLTGVTAVEGNWHAVKDGMKSAEINGIEQCRFIHTSAEKFECKEPFDIIILDPPRPGMSRRVLKKVIALRPRRIVYVSCNPATFARDIKRLNDHYETESVRMIDFFPQTHHIEALGFLRLRKKSYHRDD